MQEEIVVSLHHIQKPHSHRLSSARIRRRLACVVLPLAFSGHLTACSMQSDFSKGAIYRAADASVKPRELSAAPPVQVDNARNFEGEWSYRDDCDHGHYVTLELKREKDLLVGSWSDGTLLRGSQGLVRGRIDQGKLAAEWCSEDYQAGAPSPCPSYEPSNDYLVARDGTLVWYQQYGHDDVQYVVLKKGIASHQPAKACVEDK